MKRRKTAFKRLNVLPIFQSKVLDSLIGNTYSFHKLAHHEMRSLCLRGDIQQ